MAEYRKCPKCGDLYLDADSSHWPEFDCILAVGRMDELQSLAQVEESS